MAKVVKGIMTHVKFNLIYPHWLNSYTSTSCVPQYHSVFNLLAPMQWMCKTASTRVLTMQSLHMTQKGLLEKAPLYAGQTISVLFDAKRQRFPVAVKNCCQHISADIRSPQEVLHWYQLQTWACHSNPRASCSTICCTCSTMCCSMSNTMCCPNNVYQRCIKEDW